MNKKIIYMAIGLVLLFLTTVTFAYAWFTLATSYEGKETIVTAGTLSIHYEDGPEIIMNDIFPGDYLEKTFTVENTGSLDATYTISWKDLINTYINEELVYSLFLNDEEISGVVPISDEAIKRDIKIKANEVHEYTLKITFIEIGILQNYNQEKTFSTIINVNDGSTGDVQIALKLNGKTVNELPSDGSYKLSSYKCVNGSKVTWNNVKKTYYIEGKQKDSCILDFEEAQTIGDRLFTDNPNIKEDNVYLFAELADQESESGLFRTTLLDRNEDTDGDGIGDVVYYFRGVVENNYLIFADHCWRVVRTNEGGESIKLRYGGPATGGECVQTGTNVNIGTGTMVVNYGNSAAKTNIDNWYSANIASKGESVTSLIADVPYCNDQSGTTSAYGASTRLITNKTPQYKCPNSTDKYTMSSEIGNGKLTKPIALLTADEVAYAGGVGGINNTSYYLYTGAHYWMMSPYNSSEAFNVASSGYLRAGTMAGVLAFVPAVSISSEAIVADGGLGTYDHPYVIVTE